MKRTITSRQVTGAAILLYLVAGALLLPFYRYQIAPDAISYYSIAQHYLAGDWIHAVNGYWGPMLSWLLIPFLALGIPAAVSAKLLTLLVGAALMLALNRLVTIYALPLLIRGFVLLSSIPIILYFAWYNLSPDLLLSLMLALYCCLIFSDTYIHKAWPGILCGIVGALAYFCKQYGLMFFAAHFVLFSLWLFIRSENKGERKQVAINFLLGLFVFILLCGLWVAILNAKYGHPTLGTAGGYNQAILGPNSPGHTHHTFGFLALPHEAASSAWEDPSYFAYESWRPFDSTEALVFTLNRVLNNMGELIQVYLLISVFSLAGICGLILMSIRPWREFCKRKEWYPLGVLAIFSGGYTLVLIDFRFFPIAAILTILITGIVLNELLKHTFFSHNLRRAVLLLAVMLSFTTYPVIKLLGHLHTGREYHQQADHLRSVLSKDTRLASNDDWFTSVYLAYLSGNKYLGKARADWSNDQLQKQLDTFDIAYYLVWGDDDPAIPYLESTYATIEQHAVTNLRIFSIQ